METKILTQDSGTGRVEKVKSQKLKVKSYFHLIALVVILLLAAFLRIYRIADYMTFLGDEGRDVLVVKHLLEGDLVGLGPTASVGGFFTGPIYYYFMAPFLWLFRLDPVGPAVMVALFGLATVFLVYLVGKEFFNRQAGLFAAALYAVSPLVLGYSRSSWNPNLMPFFSLLIIYMLYKAVTKNSIGLFFIVGILFGIVLQLHYIETFLVVAAVFYISFTRSHFVQGETFAKTFFGAVKNYVVVFLGFLVGFSPFLAFEATHGFPNTITIIKFMFGATGETGFSGGKFIGILWDVLFRLFGRLITRFPPPDQVSQLYYDKTLLMSIWSLVTIAILISSLWLLFLLLKKEWEGGERSRYLLLTLWLSIGVLLFGFYKKPIYDYYFQFMFPLPFLLVGNLLYTLFTNKTFALFGKIVSIALFVWLFLYNLEGMPFRSEPNRQLRQVRTISEFVLEKTEGKAFNFALVASGNSDHAYRYFFELESHPPVVIQNPEIDPERETTTDQLLVVCESIPCHPLGHSLFEVAGFGQAEIAGEWPISVVKVYKLVHYQGPE